MRIAEHISANRRVLLGAALVWLVLSALLVLEIWPSVPRTARGFSVLLGVGPLVYLALEALMSWLFSPAHAQAISMQRFSWLRVVVALPVAISVVALCWYLAWAVARI